MGSRRNWPYDRVDLLHKHRPAWFFFIFWEIWVAIQLQKNANPICHPKCYRIEYATKIMVKSTIKRALHFTVYRGGLFKSIVFGGILSRRFFAVELPPRLIDNGYQTNGLFLCLATHKSGGRIAIATATDRLGDWAIYRNVPTRDGSTPRMTWIGITWELFPYSQEFTPFHNSVTKGQKKNWFSNPRS